MPTLTLTRNDEGKIAGIDEVHDRGYLRFIKSLHELTVKTTLIIKWWAPRSPKYHRYHFAILNAIFKKQEQFDDFETFRTWLQIGAGHCTFAPSATGKMVAIPLSINFEKMDDVEFGVHHMAVKKFCRSGYMTRFLWPHLNDLRGGEMIEVIFDSFELDNTCKQPKPNLSREMPGQNVNTAARITESS